MRYELNPNEATFGRGWYRRLLRMHRHVWARVAPCDSSSVPLTSPSPLPSAALPVLRPCAVPHACLEACPTRAIVAPYRVDARRCLSYLTIEWHGSIPLEFRRALGNRIYGCDDCQLVCPWNRFAQVTAEPDFRVRQGLDAPSLVELLCWEGAEFLRRTEGSAIRRIGHERWLRNIAVALGNAPHSPAVINALQARLANSAELVREHVSWALAEQAITGRRFTGSNQ